MVGTVIKKAIGNYVYSVEVDGFDDYRFIHKEPIGGVETRAVRRGKKKGDCDDRAAVLASG